MNTNKQQSSGNSGRTNTGSGQTDTISRQLTRSEPINIPVKVQINESERWYNEAMRRPKQ